MSEQRSFACARCGQQVPAMRLPDDWDDDLKAKWLALEELFVCGDCEALIDAHYNLA